jgi:hypothetical protein
VVVVVVVIDYLKSMLLIPKVLKNMKFQLLHANVVWCFGDVHVVVDLVVLQRLEYLTLIQRCRLVISGTCIKIKIYYFYLNE